VKNAGHVKATLGDFCTIIMGQSPPSSEYNNKQQGLPFFQGKAEFTDLHPVAVKWCNKSNKIAEVNDVLVSVRAPVGSTNIADKKCCIGRGLAAVRYDHCNKFVFYFFRFIAQKLDEQGTGTTFRAISGHVIRKYPINLPPLPEQRAIVAKIEQLFSELDNGIASLKTAQEQLKVYRQAVLKKAFEGGFVDRQKENGLPSEWKLIRIDHWCPTVEKIKPF
jgi:type I restriction enzyme S subunit